MSTILEVLRTKLKKFNLFLIFKMQKFKKILKNPNRNENTLMNTIEYVYDTHPL